MSSFWEGIAFYAAAALILGSALSVVLMRNLMHCAMALASSFLGVACVYILLGAFFLFGVQVLIYVGAITVLIVFAIMLTRDVEGHFIQQRNKQSFLGLAAAAATFLALAHTTLTGRSAFNPIPVVGSADLRRMGEASVTGIGLAFVRQYVLPFEVASVVLLVALVGAIVIARGKAADD